MSYSALLAEERQENYKLSVSLGLFQLHPQNPRKSGLDEVTLITSTIHCAENSNIFDPKPRVGLPSSYASHNYLYIFGVVL